MASRKYLSIGIGLLFLAYLVFQLRLLIFTPLLTVFFEDMRQIRVGEEVEITGETNTLNRVSFNGDAIPIDREGAFSQRVTVRKGINRIEIKAENRFGREQMRYITIIGQEPAL